MTELKIRAWDKQRHKFVEPCNFIRGGTGELTLTLVHKNASFSIYTGINDINGKEIYTGDIVVYFYEGLGREGKVILDEGKFLIIDPRAKDGDDASDWDAVELYEVSITAYSELEVIGPIFKLLMENMNRKAYK